MDREKLRLLEKTGHYLSVPRGVSMWPMLGNHTDVVDIVPVTRPLRRYDVVLYYRAADNNCVLHRVLRVEKERCLIRGDNCVNLERVPNECIMGVATRFMRRGRWVSVRDWRYRLYVHLWCDLFPLRAVILRVVHRIRRCVN